MVEVSRRGVVAGAGALAGTALALGKPALAQAEPLRIGWLAALTGPSSAPTIGFNRGVLFAAQALNEAGGVKGRQVEIVTRDTQGDPTKAVNATQEMISQAKVQAIWGPTNSGESLAVTPIMARQKVANIHPCVVNSLIDPAKYPNAFRIAPSNTQWDDAVRGYCLRNLGAKKVAVIGDTTGYGVTAAKDSTAAFKKDGAEVVYAGNIDATQPDMTPDMLRAREAGAQAVVVWTVTTGMAARLFNARGRMGWDVPFVGHPSLASGDIGGLIERPANWDKVYAVGYKSCSYDEAGKLPARSQDFIDRIRGKVDLSDTLLWWVAAGYDAIQLVAKAVEETGASTSAAIVGNWNAISRYPGIYGTYSYSPTMHDGYPTEEVVMSEANSGRNGSFRLAPGYG